MLKGRKLLIVVMIIAVVVLVGVGTVMANKKEKNDKKIVQTVEIKKQDIESHIQATGQIVSMDKREIVSDVEEKIEKVFVKKGDKVKKGQVLMKLEETNILYKIKEAKTRLEIQENILNQLKTDLDIGLKNAKIKYEDALDTYERNKKLYEANALSKRELEKSKNTLEEMHNEYILAEKKLGNGENTGEVARQEKQVQLYKLEVEKLMDDLEKHTIKSPITGTIVDMKIAESGIVESHIPLMFIQDVDNLEIITNINEYDASKIKIGDFVKITGDAFEGKTYDGKVKYVGPFAKTVETGQGKENVVEVKVEIAKMDKYLKPGFSAKLDILTERRKDVLAVPYEAIFTKRNKENVIFTVEDGKVKEHKVKLGIESDLVVEVIGEDINQEDHVIMNPTEAIKEGEEVQENQVM
ncbi:efflux RND transporter periplasmic adaptor subunit [Crassaminicella thermophila]|uniref:Efflux RND transporter periplasmic adaptor subunit n=1 Tax=Crassaminicella thermophila TaxID=2599308 RepID=A0A5C0SJJ3_CRATE|nr:efflux RND transporter periplasmic adaptor subunit [Crassaminicella thermophila]QEK13119.1 efflux RND transporter periplasmic adaptor subunit [Crassaminicella thermophila]